MSKKPYYSNPNLNPNFHQPQDTEDSGVTLEFFLVLITFFILKSKILGADFKYANMFSLSFEEVGFLEKGYFSIHIFWINILIK